MGYSLLTLKVIPIILQYVLWFEFLSNDRMCFKAVLNSLGTGEVCLAYFPFFNNPSLVTEIPAGLFSFASSPGALGCGWNQGVPAQFPWNASAGPPRLFKGCFMRQEKSNCFLYTKAFHGETGTGGGLVIRRDFMTSFKTQAPSQNVFITVFIYPS